ncbi:LytR family transcriptional regulator [Rathayibacter tanaceti]|nr:LytR family transcriptional regulator [Rathayibacter tanaceti]
MARRGWWLLAVTLLLPGSAQVLAGSRRLGRIGLVSTFALWAMLLLAALLTLVAPSIVSTVATLDSTLLVVQAALIGYGALWLLLTLDTLRLVRLVRVTGRGRGVLALAAAVVIVVSTGSAGYGAYVIGVSRGLFSTVFGDGVLADPVDGRYNILLLGGDAGEDRDGARPDSISLVSIDATSGAATIIGLPRNLQNIPFPDDSPMSTLYPDGYPPEDCNVSQCELNSIYTEVQLKSPELYPDAEARGSLPGIEAMRDAVRGILGVPVQYFVSIDMQGFSDLVDALGGIDVTYPGPDDLPLGGVLDENGDLDGVNAWVVPGDHRFDGSNALAYARSRYGSSGGDYDRMVRQRQVQEAILQQFEPVNVLTKFQGIAQAGSTLVTTDLPQAALGGFVQLAMKTKTLPLATLELTPPEVDPADPDYDKIRAEVAELLGAS